MPSLVLTGETRDFTTGEYKNWKPKVTRTPYVGKDVDEIIDELVMNEKFIKDIESAMKDIKENPQKYPDYNKKYIEYIK